MACVVYRLAIQGVILVAGRRAEGTDILQLGDMSQGASTDVMEHKKGKYVHIGDAEEPELGIYDKPLPCFGCGIGWFSFLLGFVCPLMWYYATILYFGNYYHKDPRERSGLAASAIAALICTVVVIIVVAVILL
ncbi:hypothetical protein AB3S75_001534 [Citrus x aurantiifolia]